MSITRNFSLIPNSGTYLWGTTLHQLPDSIKWMSLDSQKKFLEAIEMSAKNGFRLLKGPAREEWFNKNWEQIEKTIPKGHWTEKVFVLINSVGLVFLFAVVAKQAFSRL